ncbi:MAG: pullulanase-type alpha-1,6-glucosidase [Anaerolineaceae bacterium]|nr:MAG: pullulanase-type alpha-1,6-glucosidase [Anaerolineaceae bacterium]
MKKYRFISALVLLLLAAGFVAADDDIPAQPDTVTLVGTFQSAFDCDEWQADCDATAFEFDEAGLIWRARLDLPAGDYVYSVAVDGEWDEDEAVSLSLDGDRAVMFLYSHQTGWFADNVNHIVANVPGSFQTELGCPSNLGAGGDWAPSCLRTWLQDPEGDGIYTFMTDAIPAGSYEAKVALNESWSLNYGVDGQPDGANIPFDVMDDGDLVVFLFNTEDNVLTINTDGSTEIRDPSVADAGLTIDAPVRPLEIEQPDLVVLPGTIQSVLGCDGDWQPNCEATALTYLPEFDIWRGEFDLPAGDYAYKVAIDGSWEENYGINAEAGGADIPLSLTEDATVTFYYDHFTNWVADSVNNQIVTAPGSYNPAVGCSGEWQPDCMRAWLQDTDGDGVYTFATDLIPAGDYEVKVAIGQSWAINYGADGVRDGANIPFSVPEDGVKVLFVYNESDNKLTVSVGEPVVLGRVVTVNLRRTQAYWVDAQTVAWDAPDGDDVRYVLHYSADAALESDGGQITGGESLALTLNADGLSQQVLDKFPHLAGLNALQISEADAALVPEILRGQFAVAAYEGDELIGGTALQIPGVLDDLYTYDGALGVTYDGDTPSIAVWAPTAQNVRLHLFADSATDEAEVLDMTHDADNGVWRITGEPDWTYQFYLFEVQVFAPTVGRIVTNMVTDPYSYSLAMNSTRSQIVDIYNDPALMPDGWQTAQKPPLASFNDIAVYEIHVRDFSVSDPEVPEELVGTFAAFALPNSYGVRHLRGLAESGLTHLHLLPVFDIATIDEDKDTWVMLDFEELAAFPPDSEEQTNLIDPIRDQDPFNWGYDPFHFTAPEGSYSTEPDGVQRIIEFRQMVQALNEMGLRVVKDVVYNHTNAAGQGDKSVFDRIVPGYYHRLDANGNVMTSTCCQNTATEHNMMQRFMVDSLHTWAVAYRVDGFRVDLMGHHMLDNMIEVREMLDGLTLEDDGVDGAMIYVYGEGWDFGEVANNARGVNATQLNIGGTGIGVFNDRLRDAARGGSPFDGQQHQGFITGLATEPNEFTPGSDAEQMARLLLFSDQIRVGLAGNLRDYTFINAQGEAVTGADISYNGNPVGYTLSPQENIIYVAAHDNETLWDTVQYKAPEGLSIDQRVRMNNLGVSLVALSQGVPFFHAGDDMLRSKSLDRDSYNSGDWFNRLDFTYQTNNWGGGLPPSSRDNWDIIAPLLGDERLTVDTDDIVSAVNHMREMLQIRYSSPLFRLQTAEQIQERVAFHNTGPDQVPGVIVMSLSDLIPNAPILDDAHQMIVVVFNSRPDDVSLDVGLPDGMEFVLHPVLAESEDSVVREATYADGILNVPERTTAVFVAPR